MVVRITLYGGPDDGAEYALEAEDLPLALRVPHAHGTAGMRAVAESTSVSTDSQPRMSVGQYSRTRAVARDGAVIYSWEGWE